MITKELLPPELQQLINGLVEELKTVPFDKIPDAIECILQDASMNYAMFGIVGDKAKSQFYAGFLTGAIVLSETYQAKAKENDGQVSVQA